MSGSTGESWVGELAALRRELSEMRAEQQELTRSVQQLTQTFRALAVHLGISAEPYHKAQKDDRGRDLPGFA